MFGFCVKKVNNYYFILAPVLTCFNDSLSDMKIREHTDVVIVDCLQDLRNYFSNGYVIYKHFNFAYAIVRTGTLILLKHDHSRWIPKYQHILIRKEVML